MKVKKTYYIACREGIYYNLMHFPLERAEHTDIEQAMRYYNREFAESELERYRERNEGALPDYVRICELVVTYDLKDK